MILFFIYICLYCEEVNPHNCKWDFFDVCYGKEKKQNIEEGILVNVCDWDALCLMGNGC